MVVIAMGRVESDYGLPDDMVEHQIALLRSEAVAGDLPWNDRIAVWLLSHPSRIGVLFSCVL